MRRRLTCFLLLACWVIIDARFSGIEVPESRLDSNRSFVNDEGERVFVPKRLPKLTREEKFEFLKKQGIDAAQLKRKKVSKRRRSLNEDKPWKIQFAEKSESEKILKGPLLSVDPHLCPNKFDAITEGHNHRTYVFSGLYVYQIWRENGLQQKAAYKINEMFPDGPQSVTAAMTNIRSGVTILIYRRKVYRFRWSRKEKRFYQTRKSPNDLTSKVSFEPTLAFQWEDGNVILSEGRKFVTYDPYWNQVTFNGTISDYFPNIPKDAIGLAHNGRSTFLLLTTKNELEIYDMKKFKIVQEYPVSVHNFVACLKKP